MKQLLLAWAKYEQAPAFDTLKVYVNEEHESFLSQSQLVYGAIGVADSAGRRPNGKITLNVAAATR